MIDYRIYVGFSLVEILVSLFVVSLTAVNIVGLQKIIGEQSRDNYAHITVVDLVNEKFSDVMQFNELQDVMNLNGMSSSYHAKGTDFDLKWSVNMVNGAPSSAPIREVSVLVTWSNATGELQTFSHAKQISFVLLEKGATEYFPYTVPNLLGSNKVGYFDPRVNYKKDNYVIYDSQLFQATGFLEQAGIETPVNSLGKISNGWLKVGDIDDEELSDLFYD